MIPEGLPDSGTHAAPASAPAEVRERATCRGCGMALDGDAFMYGGRAYVPQANPNARGPREEAKRNHYGGFVCSRRCDFNASLALEQSMPGHGIRQERLTCYAAEALRRNWGE